MFGEVVPPENGAQHPLPREVDESRYIYMTSLLRRSLILSLFKNSFLPRNLPFGTYYILISGALIPRIGSSRKMSELLSPTVGKSVSMDSVIPQSKLLVGH